MHPCVYGGTHRTRLGSWFCRTAARLHIYAYRPVA